MKHLSVAIRKNRKGDSINQNAFCKGMEDMAIKIPGGKGTNTKII